MSSSQLASLRQRLTSTSSLLLERSRVLSLGLPPSAASQTQITRNLSSIRGELAQLAEVRALEDAGLVVGAGRRGGEAKRKGREDARAAEVRELEEVYDSLIGMLEEDEVGREKARTLRREVRKPSPPASPSPLPKIDTTPTPTPPPAVPSFNVEPPTPAVDRPFRDEPDDDEATPHEMLSQQQVLMDDQDERLNLLSHSINRQNTLSIQIGSELDLHHQLLEDTDVQMDRTAARLGSARRRMDKVARDAKQYGSTITIVVLIFILLVLIIVFKT